MTIVLDTPEQINAWVLMSRVSQVSLHLKGHKVKGLAAWLKMNVPAEYCSGKERTVKDFTIPLLDWCDDENVPTDRVGSLIEGINYLVVCSGSPGSNLYYDQGIYETMDEAWADWYAEYMQGCVHVFRTWDAVRGSQPKMYRF